VTETKETSTAGHSRRLRRFIQVLAAIAILTMTLGWCPGEQRGYDANHCFGRALSALGNTEHHTDNCTPSYTVMGEPRRVGGLSLSLYVVLLLGPAGWLYRDARPWRAWGWIAWNVAAAIGCLALWVTFELDLDIFGHTETLWPGYGVVVGWLAIQVLMMVALPIVILTSRRGEGDGAP